MTDTDKLLQKTITIPPFQAIPPVLLGSSDATLYLLMYWPLVICSWCQRFTGDPELQGAIVVLKFSFVPLPVVGGGATHDTLCVI